MEDVLRSKRVCPWCRQPIGQVVALDKSEGKGTYRALVQIKLDALGVAR